MATIKFQAIGGTEDRGTESCDYRGQGDKSDKLSGNRKTLLEHDFGTEVTDNAAIEKVIEFGPEFNKTLDGVFNELPEILKASGYSGLRLCVMDH